MMLLVGSSLFGCGSEVVRPNAEACWINDVGQKKKCYNTLTDYDDEGYRLPKAKPKFKPLPNGLRDLRGDLCFDANGQEELMRFLNESRKWAKEHCK